MWIITASCQSRGCHHGDQKRHLHCPSAAWLDMSPFVHHNLVPTVWVALSCHASSFSRLLPESLLLEGLAQGWVLVHLHGAGVSELARTGERCPQDSKNSASGTHPGGVRTKATTGSQDTLCPGNAAFLLHSVPGKAHPGLCANAQAGTRVALTSCPPGSCPRRLRKTELADWEDLGCFWSRLDNRTTQPPHSPMRRLHVN